MLLLTECTFVHLFNSVCYRLQKFDFDLQGQALGSNDELQIQIKDWEMVGRNR